MNCKHHCRLAWTAIVAALFHSIAAAHLYGQPMRANAELRVPVTRTLKDLLNTPPLMLDDGTLVRLGLEADQVPANAGALLYCLVEGTSLPDKWRACSLGPLLIHGPGPIHTSEYPIVRQHWLALRQCTLLFMVGVSAGNMESRTFSLRRRNGRDLGWLSIRRFGDPAQPFYAHQAPSASCDSQCSEFMQTSQGPRDPADAPAVSIFQPSPDSARLPLYDGGQPIVVRGTIQGVRYAYAEDRPLPRHVPQEVDPAMCLSDNAGFVRMRADPPLYGDPRQDALTRWWIDGQPVSAVTAAPAPEFTGPWTSLLLSLHSANIFVCLDPGALRITADPRQISFELLWCSEGTVPVGRWQTVARTRRLNVTGKEVELLPIVPQVRRSNRIAFQPYLIPDGNTPIR